MTVPDIEIADLPLRMLFNTWPAAATVTGLPADLLNLSSRSKVEIAQFVLHGVETGIRQQSVDYLGTKDFVPHALNSILADKTLKVSVQGETGLSW